MPDYHRYRVDFILLADEGVAYLEIVRRFMINSKTVTSWVKRWNDRPEAEAYERLKELPRSGCTREVIDDCGDTRTENNFTGFIAGLI